MKFLRNDRKLIVLSAAVILMSVLFAFQAVAGEPKAGDVIDATNVEQYKDYFAPFILRFIQDGWGLEEPVVIHVREPGDVPGAPKSFIETSIANAGKTKLNPDGSIEGYVSGFPFLNPKEPNLAQKIIWNQFYRFRADNFYNNGFEVVSRRKGGSIRTAIGTFALLRYACRTSVDPKPAFENNGGLYWASILNGKTPPTKDMATLTWRYNDPLKNDEMWTYVPTLRRTLRLVSSERANPIRGYPMTWDDSFGFDGKIMLFNYELVREQKMLALMTDKMSFNNRPAKGYHHPVVFAPDNPYQVVDTYLLKIVSKDPRYPEKFRNLWLLKDTYGCINAEMFDKKGELWKGYTQTYGTIKTAQGEDVTWIHQQSNTEFKTGFWVLNISGADTLNDGFSQPAMFSPGALGQF